METARLMQRYRQTIAPELQQSLGTGNIHAVPQLQKVVINVGLGRSLNDNRLMEVATTTLRKITGQQPIATKAKQSIAGFKLREGQPIGLKVTLRGARMYEFIDRLVNVVLPRARDFHGVNPKAFDPRGNYSLGIADQSIFPELTYEDTPIIHGLQVNLIIKNGTPESSRELLRRLGFPFERKE